MRFVEMLWDSMQLPLNVIQQWFFQFRSLSMQFSWGFSNSTSFECYSATALCLNFVENTSFFYRIFIFQEINHMSRVLLFNYSWLIDWYVQGVAGCWWMVFSSMKWKRRGKKQRFYIFSSSYYFVFIMLLSKDR